MAATETGRLLESLGHVVEPSHPAAMDDPEASGPFTMLFATNTAHLIELIAGLTGKKVGPDDVDPLSCGLTEMGRACSAVEYMNTIDWVHGYGRRVASWWAGGFDLLLTPTLSEPPPPLGSFVATREEPAAAGVRGARLAAFTSPFNMTGQPAISLPLHWNAAGLPIGVQLVAAYGREDVLLRVAAQ